MSAPPPRGTPNPSGPPVVCVHGIWKTGATFDGIAASLRAKGREVHAIDLTPNDGSASLEVLGAQLATFVEARVPREQPIDLVGFSMGGVVSRVYLQKLGGHARVRRFVSISAPHHGTLLAHFAWGVGGRAMRPGSPLLEDLNGDLGLLRRVDVTSIWTPLDLMIVPATSSRLPLGEEVLVAAPLHALMLHDPRAIRAIIEALTR